MIRRFCLHIRANKLQHNKGIWMPILYHETQKDITVLVQGWIKDQPEQPQSWHLWCETAVGERHDPQITLLEMEEVYYKLIYETPLEKPPDAQEDEEIVNLWELYEKDPQEFWKKQDHEVRSFRSKIFSLIKKNKF